MNSIRLKRRKIIAALMIIVGFPFAVAGAVGGGGITAFLFATILAIGVDGLITK